MLATAALRPATANDEASGGFGSWKRCQRGAPRGDRCGLEGGGRPNHRAKPHVVALSNPQGYTAELSPCVVWDRCSVGLAEASASKLVTHRGVSRSCLVLRQRAHDS
jgi:hypothetical protein